MVDGVFAVGFRNDSDFDVSKEAELGRGRRLRWQGYGNFRQGASAVAPKILREGEGYSDVS